MNDREEWLRWRKQGLGSSDYAVIMGVSPWRNILQLYEDKIQPDVIDEGGNWATSQGTMMEPKIRSLYELMSEESFTEQRYEMLDYSYMRVSLDGINEPRDTAIEIKYCRKSDWELAKSGQVPTKYIPQVQGQLIVSPAKKLMFLAYPFTKIAPTILESDKLAIVEVLPDKDYQMDLFTKCSQFWFNNVKAGIPPELPGSEYESLRCSGIMNRWKLVNQKIKELEAKRDDLRDQLFTAAKESGHKKLKCNGVRLLEISKVGNVDYKRVPELSGVNLDKYRKPSTKYWKMELEK